MRSLRRQLTKRTVKVNELVHRTPWGDMYAEVEKVTLAGKVEAILEHLGLEVDVQEEEVIPSKVVTRKVKKDVPKKRKR